MLNNPLISLRTFCFCDSRSRLRTATFIVTVSILCGAIFLLSVANAKQLGYDKSRAQSSYQFSFSWKHEGTYLLSFELPKTAFLQLPTSAARFNNAVLENEIRSAILKFAREKTRDGINVNVRRLGKSLKYSVRAESQTLVDSTLEEIKEVERQARDAYLKKHYLTYYQSPQLQDGIITDHKRYVDESAEVFKPIVDSLKSMQQNPEDPREFIQLALNWLQSIPYNDLQNRFNSNGSGFVSPRDLLNENQGDCDSKTVFLAALLKAYRDYVPMHMVIIPDHALLAVGLAPLDKDRTITIGERDFVLMEPTGPAYIELGEIAEETEMAIRNRQYSLTQL